MVDAVRDQAEFPEPHWVFRLRGDDDAGAVVARMKPSGIRENV